MPSLHSKQVKIWTDLQEQIMDAGLMTDAIDWEEGNSTEPGRITCSLNPKENGHNRFPFSGTKAEFDNLLRFIKYLRAHPTAEVSIDARPTEFRMERLAGTRCPVCGFGLHHSRAIHATREGKHGVICKCGNPRCLSLVFVGLEGKPIQTILRASASSNAAESLYRLGGNDPDEQGAADDQRE